MDTVFIPWLVSTWSGLQCHTNAHAVYKWMALKKEVGRNLLALNLVAKILVVVREKELGLLGTEFLSELFTSFQCTR